MVRRYISVVSIRSLTLAGPRSLSLDDCLRLRDEGLKHGPGTGHADRTLVGADEHGLAARQAQPTGVRRGVHGAVDAQQHPRAVTGQRHGLSLVHISEPTRLG